MRFTFLGTGTSSGVPAIACTCEVCTSTDPRDKRLRTGACLRFIDGTGTERCVLIDATPDLRQQALDNKLTRCDGVIFTHNHVDHTFGVDELRRFNAVQREPINIYAEEHTMQHLRRVYQHIFDSDRNVNQSFVATLIPNLIDLNGPRGGAIDIHGVTFTPIRVLHGRLPILGFRIERREAQNPARSSDSSDTFPLAYCTDVSAIPTESWKLFRGVRTLVIDALRYRHHPTHMTVQEAIGVSENIGAEMTYFVHMSHDLSHAATEAQLPENIRLAYDGLTIGHA